MFFKKKKWTEIYFTMETEKFFRAKNILRDNGIPFNDKTENNNLRLSFNNVSGNSMALSRDGFIKNRYIIEVEEKNIQEAQRLLSSV